MSQNKNKPLLTDMMRCITMWNKTAPIMINMYSSFSRFAGCKPLAKKIQATVQKIYILENCSPNIYISKWVRFLSFSENGGKKILENSHGP